MISIPSSFEPVQVQHLHQRIAVLEQENRQLKQQLAWEDKLFANPHLSPSHKLALRVTVATVKKAQRGEGDSLTTMYLPALADKTGLSAKTIGKNLQFLADTGAIIRETTTTTNEIGEHITRVAIGLTDQVKRPEALTPSTPRNHGGKRVKRCQDCGSDHLAEQKTLVCLDCGSVQSTTTHLVNATDEQVDRREAEDDRHEAAPLPMDNLTGQNHKEPIDNLTPGTEKPSAPPCERGTFPPAILPRQAMTERPRPPQAETERRLEQVAYLLLDIAGDRDEHIVMNDGSDLFKKSGKKYLTLHTPLTLADMRQHLQGRKTLGASLSHQDGTTRALCFDTDDNPTDSVTWQQVQEAAELLIAAGYKSLLEPSSAGRGGHLWLIFSERVNAAAAYHQVCELAPGLKDVAEYWPRGGKQKVRLPAGKYVTPTFSQWTTLYDAERRELSKSDLLDYQTPADLIPAYFEERRPTTAPDPVRAFIPSEHEAKQRRQTEPDAQHRQKYGNHAMWVAWPDEEYLIDRFNQEHTIDDLAAPERNGMINAATIGRPERTASVGVTKDGKRFTDFGAGARKEDGTQDGGDPFEFYIRKEQRDKADVLRELGQALNRTASTQLLRSGRAGEVPPLWVMAILTPAGRDVYNEKAKRAGHPTLEEREQESRAGGAGGFSRPEPGQEQGEQPMEQEQDKALDEQEEIPETQETGVLSAPVTAPLLPADAPAPTEAASYPQPERACLVCSHHAWTWTGERYTCSSGAPEHEERLKQTWIWLAKPTPK